MESRNRIYFYFQQTQGTEKKLHSLFNLAYQNNFRIVEEVQHADIIVSVGGDGAFLQAVRKTGFRQDCLSTGISRTDEAVLYFDYNLDTFHNMLYSMQHEPLEVRRFPVIKVNVNKNTPFYCLNEISIRSSIIKSIVMDVLIDDKHFETFRGDGLVVSTPTGSTGYNKSTNGAVID